MVMLRLLVLILSLGTQASHGAHLPTPAAFTLLNPHHDHRCQRVARRSKSSNHVVPNRESRIKAQTTADPVVDVCTAEDILSYAASRGTTLSLNTLGPGYRAVARCPIKQKGDSDNKDNDNEEENKNDLVLGYCSGFVRPGGKILQLDAMEVFRPMLQKAHEATTEKKDENGVALFQPGAFGVGLMLGGLSLRHGLDMGCTHAEILAIHDADKQHQRLVRHYQRLGLKVERYIGDDLSNIPDRLVWGGCGTLMSCEIEALLRRWTPTFRSR